MISVIVPCYNGARYVNRLFDCFERQLSKGFEVIIIDDGSTDSSLELIKQRANNASFACKIISINNSGVSHARNIGIKNASGDYFSFVDIDDLITDDRISFFEEYINKTNADIILTQMTKIDDYQEEYHLNGTMQQSVADRIYSRDEILYDFLLEKVKTGVCGGCFKRELIINNNLSFLEHCKYNEDLIFMWQLFAVSKKVCLTNKVDYFYMWVSGSAMSKFSEDRFSGYLGMKSLSSFMEERVPEFAPSFSRFAPARIMWSLCRQGACRMNFRDFCHFFSQYAVRNEMLNLLQYNNILVKLSAFLYILHPYIFFILVRLQGRRDIHK